MINFDNFKYVTSIVIDKLEGGYYHPNMLKDGRVKDKRYANSGETMFGIDRKAGGTINVTPIGKKFWALIDGANAKNNWDWGYRGGSLKTQLMDYVSQMMYDVYKYNANRYLSPKSQEIINSDNRLLFNFIYASWNGSGWFRKFATDFNKKVASGETNTDNLTKFVIYLRTKEGLTSGSAPNSLIKQGGQKIAEFIDELKNKSTQVFEFTNQSIKGSPIVDFLLALAIVMSGYYLVKTIRNK